MTIKKIAKLSTILTIIFSANVYAIGEGFYLGAAAGQTNTHNQTETLQTGFVNPNTGLVLFPGTTSVNPSNKGVGGRLYLGYNMNNYWALEGGFTHYGATTYNVGSPVPPLISGNPVGKPAIQENGFDFVGKGTFPISSFGVFGKLGVAVVRTSLAGSLTTTYNPLNGYINATGTTNYVRPTAAVGASFDVTSNWVTELTVSRVFGGAGFQSADLYSLGISYHFVDKYCGQFLC